MMSELESALRELEIATAALAAIPGNDVERVGAALELRLKAITRVAAVPEFESRHVFGCGGRRRVVAYPAFGRR